MKRKCIIYKSSERFNRHIAIDLEEAEEITDFLESAKYYKKFDYISDRILEQKFMYYDDYEQIKITLPALGFFQTVLTQGYIVRRLRSMVKCSVL